MNIEDIKNNLVLEIDKLVHIIKNEYSRKLWKTSSRECPIPPSRMRIMKRQGITLFNR